MKCWKIETKIIFVTCDLWDWNKVDSEKYLERCESSLRGVSGANYN